MSNLTNNRVNITATAAQLTAVKTALQTITANLPFLIGLTTEERIALPSIDVNNKDFAEDAINAGLNNAGLIPSYISVASMQNDMTLFNQLEGIAALVNQLLEKIDDTKLMAGSEAYTASLALYKVFGAAADAGVPGTDAIVSQLKTRFAGQGGAAKAPTNPNS